jgi:hypothetical protein
MISFLMHTWFLWWVVAILVILRWFHRVAVASREEPEPSQTQLVLDLRTWPGSIDNFDQQHLGW